MKKLIGILLISSVIFSCQKKTEEEVTPETPITNPTDDVYPDTVWTPTGTGPRLIFKFKFDSTQTRLNNIGLADPYIVQPDTAAFSPIFNQMAAHYIELAPTDLTPLLGGNILYRATETMAAGSNAIQFNKSVVVREGIPFFSIPLSQLTPGATYKWLRLSLSYQNYDISYKSNGYFGTGTVASFLGFKTYVTKYKIKDQDYIPSASVGGPYVNHPQGYWGFESYIPIYGYWKQDGQSPSGITTVVNPNPSSPIPAGSCVVTAVFADVNGNPLNLTIPTTITNDIIVTVSLSTNKSFEWKEINKDKIFDPSIGEAPVDMGVRGMIPKVQY